MLSGESSIKSKVGHWPTSTSYDSDIDKARVILLLDLAGKNPKAQQACDCSVTQLASSSVRLTLDMWRADTRSANVLKSGLLDRPQKRFTDEGIPIPFLHTKVIQQRVLLHR